MAESTRSARSATFTDEERAAMKEHARELKAWKAKAAGCGGGWAGVIAGECG